MEEIKKPRFSINKIALGLSLVVLGVILVFGKTPQTVETILPSYTFADEPIEVKGFGENGEVENVGVVAERITIPKISIDLPVSSSKVINGYWEVFEDRAGWGEGSGYPGELGNQVIFAHARDGLFLPLKDVELGMQIYVLTKGSWFDYEVKEVREVTPDQVEVITPTDDETLTLYTCSGYDDSKRLIVVAKPIEYPE